MTSVGHRSARETIKLFPLGLLYAVYLAVAFAVGLAVLLFQELFRDPRWYCRGDRPHRVSPVAVTIVADATWAFVAYICGYFLRCRFWMQVEWPETVEGYGSTFWIHAKMAACVVVLWPLILYCLGWYRPRWRPLDWRITRTVAALLLLGLCMAATTLLYARDIYPRTQIAFTVLMLPVVTMLFGALRDFVVYLRRGRAAVAASDF